jgi:hypothetical protein
VFRDKQLQRIMDLIDKEADAKGRLPHGCISISLQFLTSTILLLIIIILCLSKARGSQKEEFPSHSVSQSSRGLESRRLSADFKQAR